MTGKRVRFHPETDFSEKDSTLAIKRRYANATSVGRVPSRVATDDGDDDHTDNILISKRHHQQQYHQQQQQLQRPEMCERWVNENTMDTWPLETHCDLSQLLQPHSQALTCTTTRRAATTDREECDLLNSLPTDPREWSRDDVRCWLRFMQRRYPQLSEIDVQRFSMNGKALCLMSADMFNMRVPNGGSQLYKDFRFRLSRAMVGCSSS